MNLEIRDFHVPARHPVTGEPLLDKTGKPIPLIKTQKSIYLDGVLYAYLLEIPHSIAMLYYAEPDVLEAVKSRVEELTGKPDWNMSTKPEFSQLAVEDEEDEDDETFEDEEEDDTDPSENEGDLDG